MPVRAPICTAPECFTVVFKNNMVMLFVWIHYSAAWTTCWPVWGGVFVHGCWLAKLICQSGGGERSVNMPEQVAYSTMKFSIIYWKWWIWYHIIPVLEVAYSTMKFSIIYWKWWIWYHIIPVLEENVIEGSHALKTTTCTTSKDYTGIYISADTFQIPQVKILCSSFTGQFNLTIKGLTFWKLKMEKNAQFVTLCVFEYITKKRRKKKKTETKSE